MLVQFHNYHSIFCILSCHISDHGCSLILINHHRLGKLKYKCACSSIWSRRPFNTLFTVHTIISRVFTFRNPLSKEHLYDSSSWSHKYNFHQSMKNRAQGYLAKLKRFETWKYQVLEICHLLMHGVWSDSSILVNGRHIERKLNGIISQTQKLTLLARIQIFPNSSLFSTKKISLNTFDLLEYCLLNMKIYCRDTWLMLRKSTVQYQG